MKGKHDSHVFNTCDFSVQIGVHNHTKINENERISTSINSIEIHSGWNTDVSSWDADIAILELSKEIKFNNLIRPICINNEHSEMIKVTNGIVVGFGLNELEKISNVANKLEIPIKNYHNCTKISSDYHGFISARTFCGGSADGRGVCGGDSGAGVYVFYQHQFYLRGLVSASLLNNYLKCDVTKEAIFTDVTQFYDWIVKFI